LALMAEPAATIRQGRSPESLEKVPGFIELLEAKCARPVPRPSFGALKSKSTGFR